MRPRRLLYLAALPVGLFGATATAQPEPDPPAAEQPADDARPEEERGLEEKQAAPVPEEAAHDEAAGDEEPPPGDEAEPQARPDAAPETPPLPKTLEAPPSPAPERREPEEKPKREERYAPASAPTGMPTSSGVTTSTAGWSTTLYGFVEFDVIRDSTQSFTDSPANNPLLRSDASSPAYLPRGTNPYGEQYGATHSRMMFTARNTRFGFQLTAPEFAGIRATATIELDFMGNQPNNPYTKEGEVSNPNTPTETSFFTNAAVRMRHANVVLENRVVDVLLGQYYHLFGWQPHYFTGAVAFLGVPNMVFGRTPQLRLSRTVHTDPVDVQLAAAVLRPAQADSGLPDFQGGLRFSINPWQGAHGRGSGRAMLESMSVGASGVYRRFRVAEYTNNLGDPLLATSVATAPGYGLSIDGRIPVIPISSLEDKSNALTLVGSYVVGQGIGDLYTGGLHWGAPFPRPEGPQGPMTGFYGANVDPGLVMFDANGVMRVVKSRSWLVGFQYFLPIANGALVLAGNHSRAESSNNVFTVAEGGDPARTFKEARYYDVNLFVDYCNALRSGLSWQRIEQTFNAGMVSDPDNPGSDILQMGAFDEKNDRFMLASYFFF